MYTWIINLVSLPFVMAYIVGLGIMAGLVLTHLVIMVFFDWLLKKLGINKEDEY